MRKIPCSSWFAAAFLLAAAGCGDVEGERSGARGPAPARLGLDQQGRLRLGDGDRCPVCAMVVKNHPRFACAIATRDGRTCYFCGTGCLIRTWLHPEVYLGVGKKELERAVVQDYFQGRPLDALAAVWVAGSDVVGPMGPALVPLRSEADAEVFKRRHGGKETFRLGGLDDLSFRRITGRSPVPQEGERKQREAGQAGTR